MKRRHALPWLLAMLACLAASSCNGSDSRDDHEQGEDESREGDGLEPTPGANLQLNVSPVTAGQPTLWIEWNLDGNASLGNPPTIPPSHTIFIGSEYSDFGIGNTPTAVAEEDEDNYRLVIYNLATTSPSAKLKLAAAENGQDVGVTPMDSGSQTFSVTVRESTPPDQYLWLVVSAGGRGVAIRLEDR